MLKSSLMPEIRDIPALSDMTVKGIDQAAIRLKDIVRETALKRNAHLSRLHHCNIFLKREDNQVVRSFKIRGAYNKMISMPREELKRGIVCASAGNHAQGVAISCALLGVHGVVFMPVTTPQQKVNKVRHFGKDWIEIVLSGDSYDDSHQEARCYSEKHNRAFIHPFDDLKIIEGQGTVGKEIVESASFPVDMIIVPIGGGGLASGVAAYVKSLSPRTRVVGVETTGAPAMYESLINGRPTVLKSIDSFADGIAVRSVGSLTYKIVESFVDKVILVPEGKICSTMLQMYNDEAVVLEPAGAIAISALDQLKEEIKGKNIVCILSGGNNDIMRVEDIRERALMYESKKHYFIIRFPQRAGALREFLTVLGPDDDITHFEYTKKNNRESGPALVGIELKNAEDFIPLIGRLKEANINYQHINNNPSLFELLV